MENDCNSVGTKDSTELDTARTENGSQFALDPDLERNLRNLVADDPLFDQCLNETRTDSENLIRKCTKIEKDNFSENFIHRITGKMEQKSKDQIELIERQFCIDYIRKYGDLRQSQWINSVLFFSDDDFTYRSSAIRHTYENVKAQRIEKLEAE